MHRDSAISVADLYGCDWDDYEPDGDESMKQELLAEEEPTTALARTTGDPLVDMIERIASNPSVDVAKLEKIIDLQRGILRDNAKAAFDAAFAKMQPKLPVVDEKGAIKKRDGTVQSRYAKLEDIQAATKPVLAEFGFSVRYRTEWPADKPGAIRIVGILSHEQGHSEESAFEAPMDKSDFRTDVQSQGSTISYGRRYTLIDLLNIETRGLDNDGQASGRPQPPSGYPEWVQDLETAAGSGKRTWDEAWQQSKIDFRNFMVNHDKQTWGALKQKAGYR